MPTQHSLVPVGMMGVQTNPTDYHEGIGMKALMCWLLLSLVPLVYAIEDLPWTPVEIPGLEIVGDATQHLGLWFQGDFGWLNAGKGLWITHDAGRSWTLSLTAPEPRTFYDSCFINDQEGWVVLDSFPTLLFRTRDGGTTWQPMEVKLIRTSPKPTGDVYLTYIYFKDSMHGLGTFPVDGFPYPLAYLLARTDDGGEHWTEIRSGGGKIIGFGDEVRIGGASYSPDFGETFQRFSTPSELEPFFVTPLYGWAVDYYYVSEVFPMSVRWDVLKTADGGNTWSVIFSKIDGGIWGGCLMSEEVGGFLWYPSEAGDPPLFYMTYDGGLSWFAYNVPFRHGQGVPRYSYEVSCNRERKEVWLAPSFVGEQMTLFYASVNTITAVHPSSKLLSTWGAIKKIRKEY